MASVWKRLDALEAKARYTLSDEHNVREWQLVSRDAKIERLEETVRLLMAHLRLEVRDVPASPPRREVVKMLKGGAK